MSRDIKAGNILIDHNAHVYIADLGACVCLSGLQQEIGKQKLAGTPCWMAPEVVSNHLYSTQSDIWSLGITAMELFKGVPPLARFDNEEVLLYIAHGNPPSLESYTDAFPSFPSSAFVSWLNGVLKKSPEDRFTIDKVLNHRWLSQAEEGKEMLLSLLQTIPDQLVRDEWEIGEERYGNAGNRCDCSECVEIRVNL